MKRTLFLVLLAAADALPADVATTPIAPPPCEKPRIPGRASVAPEDVAWLSDKAQVYGECLKPWIDERTRRARELQVQAKAETDAANAVILDLNELSNQINILREKNKRASAQ